MIAQANIKKINYLILILSFVGLFLQTMTKSVEDFPDFDSYCKQFDKKYDNGQYEQRRQTYNQNIQQIINSNCSAKGVNMFTDSTPQQMQQLKGGFEANIPQQTFSDQNSNNQSKPLEASGLTLTDKTPLTYDWRDYKAVTPVKYQKSCGSCWAFSTTAFFQSDFIINNNYTSEIDLSQQFLLKCDNRSLKCDGGFLFWAMTRIIDETLGMPTENQYPYNYSKISEQNGMCYETDLIKVDNKKKMISFFNVEDPKFIEKMILKKPVNVNMCSKDLQFYSPSQSSRTLFCDPNVTKRDHTVLLVGYTQTEWIIKNQWSTSWGVRGYGYISKNSDQDCCIGKQLYTTGVISDKCNVQNCQTCVEQTSCYQCKQGYYVYTSNSQHSCRKCSQLNCEKCLNFFGVCDVCKTGYSVVYPYYTCQKSTIENCGFMYLNKCGECHYGYTLNSNGQCVSQKQLCKVDGCQKCKQYEPTVCITCQQGYQLNNFTLLCDKLPECNVENCSKCLINNANLCQVCSQQGYKFSQMESKCVLQCLIDGCQSCALINKNEAMVKQCLQCRPGYLRSNDNLTCQKCQVQYCADCSTDLSACIYCVAGFYFNITSNKCQQCSDIDSNCRQCSVEFGFNKVTCLKCNNGFSLSNDGNKCVRCLSDCITTSYSSLSVCSDKCGPMNYFDQNVCNKCPPNCQYCSSGSECSKCLEGFVLQNGKCYKACKQGTKCGSCQLGAKQSLCRYCVGGYKMQNGQCVFDQKYQCLQKNALNPQGCVSCPQKYYLNSNYPRKVCSKCQTTDSNCVGCTTVAPGTCSKCADQYYLEKVNKTCIKCQSFDSNCYKCSANNLCTQCKQGYYLLSTQIDNQNSGLCYACSPSCLTCKYNSQFCTSCAEGYELTLSKKCLKKIKIKFSIVVEADYDLQLNSFLLDIYDNLAEMFKLETSQNINIFKVQRGSIKVTGYFHMPEGQTDGNVFLENTKSSFANNQKVGKYGILSSQADLISDPEIIFDDFQNSQMFVLIGVAVGGGVFAIIVVIVLIWVIRKYGCKKEKVDQKAQAQAKAARSNPQIKVQKQASEKSSKSTKTTNPVSQKSAVNKAVISDTDKYLNDAYPYEYPVYLRNQEPTI